MLISLDTLVAIGATIGRNRDGAARDRAAIERLIAYCPSKTDRVLHIRTERFAVIDLVYVLATFAFFGLMVAYVRACQHLGRAPSDVDKSVEETL